MYVTQYAMLWDELEGNCGILVHHLLEFFFSPRDSSVVGILNM